MRACVLKVGGKGRAGVCMSNAGAKRLRAECGGEGRAGAYVWNVGVKAGGRVCALHVCGMRGRRAGGQAGVCGMQG